MGAQWFGLKARARYRKQLLVKMQAQSSREQESRHFQWTTFRRGTG
jgi:hypothetical protein